MSVATEDEIEECAEDSGPHSRQSMATGIYHCIPDQTADADQLELSRLALALQKNRRKRRPPTAWKAKFRNLFTRRAVVEQSSGLMSGRDCWSGSLVSLGSIVGTSSADSGSLCMPCQRGKRPTKKTLNSHSSVPSSPRPPKSGRALASEEPADSAAEPLIYPAVSAIAAAAVEPATSIEPLPPPRVHTQVDYVHHLVKDLPEIFAAPFYWGVMDRYEAERLLDGKPEGTFLLRDSAQVDFLFSVSFRRYSRTLHARIEHTPQHRYTFDAYDETVHSCSTVCGLIDHYKDPTKCMYFEPLMSQSLLRTFPQSLEDLCRGVICSNTSYDGVNELPLPNRVRDRLRYYHYKLKVGSRSLDADEVDYPVESLSALFIAD